MILKSDEKTLVMGIINVTPDSFSDGGVNFDKDDAVRNALQMISDGADVIDVGGESTRPGYTPVDDDEEIRRICPVIKELSGSGISVSVDTYKPAVARAALDAGAEMINDITGLLQYPKMAELIASSGAYAALMFNNRIFDEYCDGHAGEDIVSKAVRGLSRSLETAERAGIAKDRIMIDPGVGFGTTRQQDIELMRCIGRLKEEFGLPVLLGTSRKRIVKEIGATGNGKESSIFELDHISAGLEIAGVSLGADMVRVHDVKGFALTAKGYDYLIRKE